MTRIVETVKRNFNIDFTPSLLAVDMEKAFDALRHDGLIHKLIQANLPTKTIKLIKHYLEERQNTVSIITESSEIFRTSKSIQQGSALGTALFLFYINEIRKQNNTEITVFADDTAITASSKRSQQVN